MSSFYSPYVNHCIRFYAKYPNAKRFKTDADKLNHKAVEMSLKGFTNNEVNVILEAYSPSGDINDNIYRLSKKIGIDKKSLWKIICDFERKVAKTRGLI